eukprot:TRINITY_DN11580_c0_g1_i1.p2 TRINITY_DN11580_c0_g1~~TRINITY_DN11580_c0_g1_i1.p2  ORF type:complete len:569 (-),score=14.21 TRINITY_DN11580_c0_g1_i1:1868-3499(-)
MAKARKNSVPLAEAVARCQSSVGSILSKQSSGKSTGKSSMDRVKSTAADATTLAVSAGTGTGGASTSAAGTLDVQSLRDNFEELEDAMIRVSAVGQALKKMGGAKGLSRMVANDAQLQQVLRQPPTKATSIVDLVVDYGGSLVQRLPNDVTQLTFNGSMGARVHSALTFPSGAFSARLQCPQGQASGLDTTFYLSSIEGGPGTDAIVLSVFGNSRSRVRCLVVVDGVAGSTQEVDVGGDCSVGSHNVTILWSNQLVVWMYDNQVLRVLSRDMLSPFPASTAMFLYASIYNTAPFAYAWQAGFLTNADAPYRAVYSSMSAQAPIGPGSGGQAFGLPLDPGLGAPTGNRIGRGAMWPVAIDYCSDHVVTQRGFQSIMFDNTGCGGRFHSTLRYFSGTFTALYQCPTGNASGLVSAFYLSSEEGSRTQDEIDFEFLGKNHRAVQTNFYVNGAGGREVLVPLPYDCSDGFHNYTLVWNKMAIKWYVDSRLVREVQSSTVDAFPVKPMFAYGSIWNASSIINGGWSGVYSGVDAPYYAQYKDVRIGSA